jgi:hypothetical protein
MKMHDLKNGYQTKCQICSNEELEVVLDLGVQPLSDKLPRIGKALEAEVIYPLVQVWCSKCSLNQLNYVCASEIMFGDDYSYKTGVTKELIVYQANMAAELVAEFGLSKENLVCDIGSNDGTLLKGFVKQGVKVIGVEPTDVADIANHNGISTLRMPFGEDAAKIIVDQQGKASLATATNVFAHVQSLGDFIRGLDIVLEDDGVFCFENHYLLDILKDSQFDTIYHEHLRTLSVSAIVNLFKQYNYTVIKVKKTLRYGGNIRVIVKKGTHKLSDTSVEEFLEKEKKIGLFKSGIYKKFNKHAVFIKMELLKLLIDLKEKNKSVIGYSLPARAVTLINYVGINSDLMPYLVEQPASLKLNRFVPGTHIPIISNKCLEEESPDYLVIFAWHLKDEIIAHLRDRGLKGKCIIPLPSVKIIEL